MITVATSMSMVAGFIAFGTISGLAIDKIDSVRKEKLNNTISKIHNERGMVDFRMINSDKELNNLKKTDFKLVN